MHDVTGRVRRLLAEREQPVADLATQLDRMPMPSILQRGYGVGLHPPSEPIEGGPMQWDGRSRGAPAPNTHVEDQLGVAVWQRGAVQGAPSSTSQGAS